MEIKNFEFLHEINQKKGVFHMKKNKRNITIKFYIFELV